MTRPIRPIRTRKRNRIAQATGAAIGFLLGIVVVLILIGAIIQLTRWIVG